MSEKITFNGTATFYMKSGNKFDVICDDITVNRSSSTGEVTRWNSDGMCGLTQTVHVSPSQIEAVIWNPIPVEVTVGEDGKSAWATRAGELVSL